MNLKKYLFPEPKGLLPSIIGGGSGYLRRGRGSGGGSWQWPSGYYMPAKQPMVLAYPRPNAEIGTNARTRYAYADGTMEFRVPICIAMGAWPFYAVWNTQPSGATISNVVPTEASPNPDYLVIRWVPTARSSTPVTFDLTVYDQGGDSVNVSFTTQPVDDTDGVITFVDPNAITNGTGTKASPLQPSQLSSLFVADSGSASAYLNTHVIFRGGTLTMVGQDLGFGIVSLRYGKNPGVWYGYTGETAILDFSSSGIFNANFDDVYFGQLQFKDAAVGGWRNGPTASTNTYFYLGIGEEQRTTFFEIDFNGIDEPDGSNAPPASDSNDSCIHTGGTSGGVYRDYFIVKSCTCTNCSKPIIDGFTHRYYVYESNEFISPKTTMPESFFYVKDSHYYGSIRLNRSVNSYNYSVGFIVMTYQTNHNPYDENEVCWNFGIGASDSADGRGVTADFANPSNVPTTYIYRNSLILMRNIIWDYHVTEAICEENLVYSPTYGIGWADGTNSIVTLTNNLNASGSDVTAGGLLTGTARTNYLGIRGQEKYTEI